MATSSQKKFGLTSKILFGMATGIALGLILRNAFPESDIVKTTLQKVSYMLSALSLSQV